MQAVDRIIWRLVPQWQSIPKKTLRKAIKKFGNSNILAKELSISRQRMSSLVHKICQKGQRLVSEDTGEKWAKIVKIQGFARDISRPY